MCLWLQPDQFICSREGCLIMPVWLDAVPEKAPLAKRPVTQRWLLLLVIFILAGAALTFWNSTGNACR